MASKIESRESQMDNLQTGLHLFDRPGVNIAVRKRHHDGFVDYSLKYRNVDRSLNNLYQTTTERMDRLSKASHETGDQMEALYSSAVAGIVYLKLLDEFQINGMAEEHAYDFFRKYLEVNDEKHAAVNNLGTVGRVGTRSVERFIEDRVYSGLSKTAAFISMDPPLWYTGSRSNWRKFLQEHTSFASYLSSSGRWYKDAATGEVFPLPNDWKSGYTMPDAHPDWVDNGHVPLKDQVVEELREDSRQSVELNDNLIKITDNFNYLDTHLSERYSKGDAFLKSTFQRIDLDKSDFADLLLLVATSGYYSMAEAGIVERFDGPGVNHKQSEKDGMQERDRVFKYAIEGGEFVYPELIALYLERVLQEGKIFPDASTVLDPKVNQKFSTLFRTMQMGPEQAKAEIGDLRNDKQWKKLWYEVRPFLAGIPPDDVAYLEELTGALAGSPIEALLWDIAELISKYPPRTPDPAMPGKKDCYQDMGKFSVNWLRKNWKQAFKSMKQYMEIPASEKPQHTEHAVPQRDTVIFAPEKTGIIDEAKIDQEIEEEVQMLKQGNLAGWQLLYSLDKSTNGDLVEIGGNTLVEREEALTKFIVENKIPHAIKISSIMNAFDWLVTSPDQVEWVRIRKSVNGETFRKLKRGNMRIFYDLSPEDKQIIFFLHMKKAFHYGF